MSTPLEVCLFVVKSFIGKWYLWGGDDPAGFDCSGLMVEGLKAAGVLSRGGDWTADQLMKQCGFPESMPEIGCLVFWGTSNKATHVEMIVGVSSTGAWTIGASGGGSTTRTIDDAREQNAYIKVRPMRPGHISIRSPWIL